MVTINLLFVITALAGILAIVDGIARLRGRGGGGAIVGVAEIVFAALMLVALFGILPTPFGLLTWALLLEAALLIGLFVGRGRRGGLAITIIALVLNTIVVLVSLGWLHVPGLF